MNDNRKIITAENFTEIVTYGTSEKYKIKTEIVGTTTKIYDVIVEGLVTLKHLQRSHIFINFEFRNSFLFTSTYNVSIIFINCDFKENLIFRNVEFKKAMFIIDSNIEMNLTVESGVFKNFHIDCNVKDLFIKKGEFGNLLIGSKKNRTISSLVIGDPNLKGPVNVENSTIDSLAFDGAFNNNVEFFIRDCIVSSVTFSNFVNDGKIRFFDVNVKKEIKRSDDSSQLTITRSNLGKAEFYNFDLNSFYQVIISKSYISECIFVNATWPKKILTQENELVNTKQTLIDRRETYRQLKYSLYKQADYIGEQYFHGLEMNTYFEVLS